MKYICKCGNESSMSLGNFLQGKRCKKCSTIKAHDKTRFSFEYVKNLFEKNGCVLLENEYSSTHKKLKYICKCGNESITTFNMFKQGGRCVECAKITTADKLRLTYEYVKQYFKDNNCELLETKYVNAHIKMRYICICGKENYINFNNFQQGKRCRMCGIKSGEDHPNYKSDREEYTFYRDFVSRIARYIRNLYKTYNIYKMDRFSTVLGYSSKEFYEHITLYPGFDEIKDLNWSFDHIFPIKAFYDANILDLKIINSLDNLRPLLLIENVQKRAKYDPAAFKQYLLSKNIII